MVLVYVTLIGNSMYNLQQKVVCTLVKWHIAVCPSVVAPMLPKLRDEKTEAEMKKVLKSKKSERLKSESWAETWEWQRSGKMKMSFCIFTAQQKIVKFDARKCARVSPFCLKFYQTVSSRENVPFRWTMGFEPGIYGVGSDLSNPSATTTGHSLEKCSRRNFHPKTKWS